jgi:glycosyltransferase involved in cell wall biosynthesis
VLLEAMAAGLPVAATDVGGAGEVVSDGLTGQLVPASNPSRLAEALSTYVRDEALRARHGSAGRRKAETGFSLEQMISAYVELYDGLLDARTNGTSRLTEQKEN